MKKLYLVIVLLLSGVLAWRFLVPVQRPAIHEDADADKDSRVEDVLATMDFTLGFGPVEVYPEIVNRPLFFKERKPPEPYVEQNGSKKPVSTPKRAGAPPRVSLKGIVRIGEETFALVNLPGSKNSRRLRVGEELDGWTVSRIDSDKLVLSNSGSSKEVPLREYKPVLPANTRPRQAKGRKVGGSVAKRKKAPSAIRPKRALPPRRSNP